MARVLSTLSQNRNSEMNHREASRIARPQPVTTSAMVFFVFCLGLSLAWSQNDVLTQHNTVYAFDADRKNASPLWSVSLNGGGTSDPIADYGCTGTHYTEIGIMGTPVIDPGKTTLYVVAKTLTNTVRNFSLHALDITTGSERSGGPVIISGTAQSGNGSGTFNP